MRELGEAKGEAMFFCSFDGRKSKAVFGDGEQGRVEALRADMEQIGYSLLHDERCCCSCRGPMTRWSQ